MNIVNVGIGLQSDLVIVVYRTIFFYFIVLFIFRLMGKREIGELSILDLIIFMMQAELVVIGIEDVRLSIWTAVIPMMVLAGLQLLLAYISLHSQRFRSIMDGKPSIIIEKGKVNEKSMRKLRYNFDDLLLQLREGGVGDIRDVEYAILETSGKLSIFKKTGVTESALAFPLIMDGIFQEENLKRGNISKETLLKKLQKKGYGDITDISYCSMRDGKIFVDEEIE